MSWRSRLLRLAALVAGIVLVAWLINDAGPRRVLAATDHAVRWLPLVALIEVLIAVAAFCASRALVGDAGTSVSPALWCRATAFAYASSILLPAGRAAGEATRAATLAPAVGMGPASGACTRLQAASLFANALVSTAIALAIGLGARAAHVLPWALLGNAVVCALGGAVLILLLRNERFQAWLRRLFPKFVRSHVPQSPARERSPLGLAILFELLGRLAQTTQYGIVARAVGGVAAPRVAMTAQGVHLVGAALGDAIPNQMGATDGAYRFFSHALGMEPSQALSIALVVRAAQLALALACLVVGVVAVRQPRIAEPR